MILAWHNEAGLKDAVMERLAVHQRLDEIVQGIYWEGNRGCQLGCLTHDDDDSHGTAERLFGIHRQIGYWLEAVFEGVPKSKCVAWVLDSCGAIPVGADLSKCRHHFGVWLQSGESGIFKTSESNHRLADLHRRSVRGDIPSRAEWSEAAGEANAAAWAESSVAWSEMSVARAARAAAASAAWAAREASEAAWSAARAARAASEAAWSDSEYATRAAWKKMANKSLEIFSEAPVANSPGIGDELRVELCQRNLWCPDGVAVSTKAVTR